MKQDTINFDSRRNSVKAYPDGDSYIVEKSFADKLCCEKEAYVYRLLEGKPLRTAKLISAETAKLMLTYLPGMTFVQLLERQEQLGQVDFAPWRGLGRWLLDFNAYTGMCMTDVNLKNFLYDEANGSVAGLDFEECSERDAVDMAAGLCAFILLYSPENTALKRRISGYMSEWFAGQIPFDSEEFAKLTDKHYNEILARRQTKRAKPMEGVSAVLLAGGCSSRMGRNKAELTFRGLALIDYQITKLEMLGIEDVIVSGCTAHSSEARDVPDIYPDKGPLSGIHAGLLNARFDHCLVLSVDAPLVPENILRELIQRHISGREQATVLEHGGKLEPLIGVYEKALSGAAENILKSDNTSIRALLREADYHALPFAGDEALLLNCNTPQEYRTLCNWESVNTYTGLQCKSV